MRYGVLFLLFIATHLFAAPLDRVAAIVNDGVITTRDLQAQVLQTRTALRAQGLPVPADRLLRKQALDYLIDVAVQTQLAKKNKLEITATDIDTAQADIAKRNHINIAQLREALQAQGMDWKQYRQQIGRELLLARVQQQAVSFNADVSRAEIDRFIKNIKPDTSQVQYHVRDLLIPVPEYASAKDWEQVRKRAYSVRAQIRGGQSLDAIPAQSTDGALIELTDLGMRHPAELPAVFLDTISHMKRDQISQPVRADNGYHILQLKETQGQIPIVSREDAKKMVQQQHFSQAVQKWLKKMRATAYIKIMDVT